MTDLDRLLRRLDDLPPRDVWSRVGTLRYGDRDGDRASPISPPRRIVAAVAASALATAGIGFAYVALRESPPRNGVIGSPVVPTEELICDFPNVRPTYLPWLAPGEPIPEPEHRQTADGGGPQGLDPGYSILSWSHGDVTNPGPSGDVGTVSLWRATQSVLSFPEDRAVPALPDGSTGRLTASQQGGADWAIIWGDPSSSTITDDCTETTLVLYFPNLSKEEGRREILTVAGSLVPATDVD